MSGLSTRLLLAALLGAGGVGGPKVLYGPRRALTAPLPRPYAWRRPRGPGWTAAQVKRMAKKARNQRRHKLACRGAHV